jgi:hypothetical protein
VLALYSKVLHTLRSIYFVIDEITGPSVVTSVLRERMAQVSLVWILLWKKFRNIKIDEKGG